jgi:hypothetical protein
MTTQQFYTREQLTKRGEIDQPPYSFLSKAFVDLFRGNVEKATLFHSDVIYVRAALEKRTGFVFSLLDVEAAMRAQGWKKERKPTSLTSKTQCNNYFVE